MSSYRVVFHVHSTWSYDGHFSVGETAAILRRFGAQIIMMSEHSQRLDHERLDDYVAECRQASTGGVRVVPGIEYSSPKNRIHVTTWGLNGYVGEEIEIGDLLRRCEQEQALAILAHPSRRDVWRDFDPAWKAGLYGIEVWNRKTDGLAPSARGIELAVRHGLNPVVALDFHNRRQLFPLHHVFCPDCDVETLSNRELVSLMRLSTLAPRVAALPYGVRKTLLSTVINATAIGLDTVSRPLRRAFGHRSKR